MADRRGRSPTKTKTKPCRFYANGRCKKGKQCDFTHNPQHRQENLMSRSVSSSGSRHDTNWVSFPDRARSQMRCNYFANTGRCRYGAQCDFLHDRNTPSLLGPIPSLMDRPLSPIRPRPMMERPRSLLSDRRRPFCHYFNADNCTKGDACPFSHVPTHAFSAPASPANVKVTEVGADSVSLSWDVPESDIRIPIKGYVIEKNCPGVDDVFTEALIVRGDDKDKARVDGLEEGKVYKFRVFAYSKSGFSTSAAEVDGDVKTICRLPPSVTNLHVSKVMSNSATLHWDQPKKQAGNLTVKTYIVEQKVGENGKFEPAVIVDGDTLTVTLVCEEKGQSSYDFRVFASCGDRRSAQAAYTSVHINRICLPSPPQNLRVKSIDMNKVTVCWDDNPLISTTTEYVVQKCLEDTSVFQLCAKVDAGCCSYTLRDLQPQLRYKIRMFAVNEHGQSAEASMLKRSVMLMTVPASPANVKVTELGSDSVSLSWDVPESDEHFPIKGYIVEKNCPRVNDVFREACIIRGGDTCKAEVDGLEEGKTYRFRVFAYNKAGFSTRSALLDKDVKPNSSGNDISCKICMDASVTHTFLPCKHTVCCENCAKSLTICPICRQAISSNSRIFL